MLDFVLDPPSPLAGPPAAKPFQGHKLVRAGSPQSFVATLQWDEAEKRGVVLDLQLASGGTWTTGAIQPHDLGHFLLKMASAWNRLCVEETYPLEARPENPSELFGLLKNAFASADTPLVERQFDQYRRIHDVSAWLPENMARPSLWIMREGRLMIMEFSPTARRFSLAETLWSLEQLGEMIAMQLRLHGVRGDAAKLWQERYNKEVVDLKALFTAQIGRAEEHVGALIEANVVTLPTSRSEMLKGLNEVSAAARMVPTSTPTHSLATIAKEIRSTKRSESSLLQDTSQRAVKLVSDQESIRRQAILLAEWLRQELGLGQNVRVSPLELLGRWNVAIREIHMPPTIEAVSFWGEQHGPAILLNGSSRLSQNAAPSRFDSGTTRFTLSHEICHLLVDRAGSLPVAEVLDKNRRAPKAAERRADIFACHFLLPLDATATMYQQAASLHQCIGRLSRQFGVTPSLARYQLYWRGYGGGLLRVDDYEELKKFAERR